MERNMHRIEPRPFVGLGVYIIRNGKILLGKRKGSSVGEGEFAPPGGALEFGETFEEAAQREVFEETGLAITNIRLFLVDNNLGYLQSDNKHFVSLQFRAECTQGEPEVREPEKCEFWEWYSPDDLPTPLSEFTANAMKYFNNNAVAHT